MGVRGALLTDIYEAEICDMLGELVLKRIEVRDLVVDAQPVILQTDGQEVRLKEFFFLHFWSFETFADQVEVVSGQLPGVEADVQDQSFLLVDGCLRFAPNTTKTSSAACPTRSLPSTSG